MINIAQPNPAAWSPPASGAVAPVAAVSAIRPLQESARNGQTGTQRELSTPGVRTNAQETARQGRDPTGDGGRGSTGRVGLERGAPGDMLVRQEAEQNAKQVAAEQAANEVRRAQRQELLSNVWKASAAVVDRVLGREDAAAIKPVAKSEALLGRQPVEQLSLPWPVMPQDASSPLARTRFPAMQEVVAYDERGNSNLAPLETGVLISRRV